MNYLSDWDRKVAEIERVIQSMYAGGHQAHVIGVAELMLGLIKQLRQDMQRPTLTRD
jgi:hypothetical protein